MHLGYRTSMLLCQLPRTRWSLTLVSDSAMSAGTCMRACRSDRLALQETRADKISGSTRNSLLHFDLQIALTGSPVWRECTSTEHIIDVRRPPPHTESHRNYPTLLSFFFVLSSIILVSSWAWPDFTTKITRISSPKTCSICSVFISFLECLYKLCFKSLF